MFWQSNPQYFSFSYVRNPINYIDIEKTATEIHYFLYRNYDGYPSKGNPNEITAHAIAHYFINAGIPQRYVKVIRYNRFALPKRRLEDAYAVRVQSVRPASSWREWSDIEGRHVKPPYIYVDATGFGYARAKPDAEVEQLPRLGKAKPSYDLVKLKKNQNILSLANLLETNIRPVPVFTSLNNEQDAEYWVMTRVSRDTGSHHLKQQAIDLLGIEKYQAIMYQKQLRYQQSGVSLWDSTEAIPPPTITPRLSATPDSLLRKYYYKSKKSSSRRPKGRLRRWNPIEISRWQHNRLPQNITRLSLES